MKTAKIYQFEEETMDRNSRYRIGQVAKILNIPVSTLKHYESSGRLPPSKRDVRGWRYYTEEDLLKIRAFFLGR